MPKVKIQHIRLIIAGVFILLVGISAAFWYWGSGGFRVFPAPRARGGEEPPVKNNNQPGAGTAHFEHLFGFSFDYPNDLKIENFEEGAGEMIVAENTKGDSAREFQIFVTPFNEEGPLTPERIKKDAPAMVVENPLPVLLGKDKKIQGLIFFGTDAALGRTREIWFVKNDLLFQVTARADADAFIGPIMDSFSF